MSTTKLDGTRSVSFYTSVLRRAPRVPRSLIQFADMCGQTPDIIKRALRKQGTTYKALRNAERDARITALPHRVRLRDVALEVGFMSPAAFGDWHVKHYNFSWSARQFPSDTPEKSN